MECSSDELIQRIGAEIEAISDELGRAPNASELAGALGMHRQDVIDGLVAMSVRCAGADVIGDTERADTQNGEEDWPALAALSELERTVLSLRCFHSVPQTQIAKRLHMSPARVYEVLTRALEHVRDQLADQTGMPNR